MSVIRTASRPSISPSSSSGRKPSMRDQSVTYGIARLLRLQADEVLDRPPRPAALPAAAAPGAPAASGSAPDAQSPRCRAITIRCTSFVPSPISSTFWSR